MDVIFSPDHYQVAGYLFVILVVSNLLHKPESFLLWIALASLVMGSFSEQQIAGGITYTITHYHLGLPVGLVTFIFQYPVMSVFRWLYSLFF